MASMLRVQGATKRIVNFEGYLQTVNYVIKNNIDEELTANSFKIIRNCIQDPTNHLITIQNYPNMINDLIQTFKFFESEFITSEMI